MGRLALVKSGMRPKLGFLGAGWIGRHRIEALARADVAELCAVCDPSTEALALLSTPGLTPVASLAELLESGIDGVVIATPSACHAEQCLQALESQVAVFCQRPLGRNALEVQRVVDAARAANRLLGVDFPHRQAAAAQEVRRLVQEGQVGDVFGVELVFHNAYGPQRQWCFDRAQAGGGCVLDAGLPLLDLALWCLGYPEVHRVHSRLFAQGARLRPGTRGVEDYALTQLDLASGTSIRLSCSWKLPVGCDALIEASFYGTRGGACLRNVQGSCYDLVAEHTVGTRRERRVTTPDAWGGRAAVAWAKRLQESPRWLSDVEQLVELQRVIDRIYAGE